VTPVALPAVRDVEVLEALPRSPLGKLLRGQLIERDA